LVFDIDVVLPIEVQIPSKRIGGFEEQELEVGRLFHLDTIEELREKARTREATLKRRVETKFFTRVSRREFWKGAYCLETLDGGSLPRTWNVANLQFYYS